MLKFVWEFHYKEFGIYSLISINFGSMALHSFRISCLNSFWGWDSSVLGFSFAAIWNNTHLIFKPSFYRVGQKNREVNTFLLQIYNVLNLPHSHIIQKSNFQLIFIQTQWFNIHFISLSELAYFGTKWFRKGCRVLVVLHQIF